MLGVVMILAGFLVGPPAHAEVEDLDVNAYATGGLVEVFVDRCNTNSSGVTYEVRDWITREVVVPQTPVGDWDGEWKFTFVWTAQESGDYLITVRCLAYLDRVDQVGGTYIKLAVPGLRTGTVPAKLPNTGN